MDVSTAYIAASANRHSNAVDINSLSTVFFGSSNLIALWDISTDTNGIVQTLPGHESTVTCIRIVDDSSFVSADDTGVVHYWTRGQVDTQACILALHWKSTCKLQAHPKAISSLCVLDDCLATGSSDGTVKVWRLPSSKSDDVEIKELQTISLSGRYSQALAMSYLPQSKSLLLAIGGTDKNIQLWSRSDETSSFVRSSVLSGHEDWVRGLDFRPSSDSEVLVLASGSQDATIRLWNIESYKKESLVQTDASKGPLSDDLLDAFEESLGEFADDEGGRQISLKRHIMSIKTSNGSALYSVTFDALLVGHEAGITFLRWRPSSPLNSTPTLLSSSTDSSVILWSPSTVISRDQDESTSIWINRQRFGDVGGQRLGGFIGGIWCPDGNEVMAWGWSGGWRRWRCARGAAVEEGEEDWEEVGAIGGHSGPVKNLCWCPNGAYLASTGLDQTTRIHGPVTLSDGKKSWHELARPQVHGYDLLGVSFLSDLKFASIADEKVVRVFEAPLRFIELAENLGVAQFPDTGKLRPASASVPPLGLSNKASEAGSSAVVSPPITRRPFEGELAATTLWPEIEKVFGHGYESISLASSHSRKHIATACKATTPEHAVVRVYDTTNWQLIGQPLAGHSLTVTQITFSPDDQFVLTVSRDRSWRMYQVQGAGGYAPVAAETKAHGRIIWDCTWSHEGDLFATASRDKTVKIWNRDDAGKWRATVTLKTSEAATAVDFTPFDAKRRRLIAVGLENGHICIYSNTEGSAWEHKASFDSSKVHVNHITSLRWRPQTSSETQSRELASCSEDGTLRILIVHMD
ncbi:hypothetical protein D9758_001112 [Tetrapyrgos nigripes]|uniref:Elongator complex protein 2 n=1 Tax=Tetrapyrgos nigripes TaxID=182062 RepID=A0A8H5LUC3_9AGAR|nr:hypothetical protein D9758_001112 [Tetrapyrgos nigripes]